MAKIRWHRPINKIVEQRVLQGGKTALFAATTWHRLITPFTPMDTGYLANDSVTISATKSVGYIRYKTPYARINYFGATRKFQVHKHRLASYRWDLAAKRAGKDRVLIKDVNAYRRRK
jgi:hypothetical protein